MDASGNVYVADTGNHRIQKFTSTGTYLTQWATGGAPFGVAVDADGNVYVAGLGNSIQKFTGTGAYLTQWGASGSGDPGAVGPFQCYVSVGFSCSSVVVKGTGS